MRRKRLNHYADVVCRMFVGWRMGDDLEVLSEVPDGTITIDLLKGTANHSVVGNLELHISQEIAAWLSQQSAKEGINWSEMKSATLEVLIDTGRVATNKKKVVMFNFTCLAKLSTSEACYEANLIESAKWHTRTTKA